MTKPSDRRWRDRALCAETDPEAFFPEAGASAAVARRVCAACPVRTECLTDALNRHDVSYGVLGGLTPNQRRDLLREKSTGTGQARRVA